MYDVVKVKTINGQRVYFCMNDTQEEKLFANLNKLVDQELKDQKRLANESLLGNFMNFFSTEKLHYTQLYEFICAQKRVDIPYHFSIRKINLDIPNPPPNQIT